MIGICPILCSNSRKNKPKKKKEGVLLVMIYYPNLNSLDKKIKKNLKLLYLNYKVKKQF